LTPASRGRSCCASARTICWCNTAAQQTRATWQGLQLLLGLGPAALSTLVACPDARSNAAHNLAAGPRDCTPKSLGRAQIAQHSNAHLGPHTTLRRPTKTEVAHVRPHRPASAPQLRSLPTLNLSQICATPPCCQRSCGP
jgi:hypothetical protein